jgi:hypothetical protein
MERDKKIQRHGDFQQLAENLWTLEGELPHGPLPRTMTVYRMKDGGLWIHSAIALEDEYLRKLEQLGKPAYLVVPNTMHRMDAGFYKEAFPQIKVVCPEGAREKVEKEVRVDATCEVAFANSEIRVDVMPGVRSIELAYELPLTSGKKAMVFNDVIANVPELKGVGGFILKVMGRIGFFRTPPITKLILLNDRSDFKVWLQQQSQRRDIDVVTVSHGQSVQTQIPQLFKRAASMM